MSAAHLAAVIVAIVACATDLRSRRIPNVLTFSAAALGMATSAWTGGPEAAMTSSAGWIAGFAIFFVPFALRGLGGGDVKLLAALGAWVGPTDVIESPCIPALPAGSWRSERHWPTDTCARRSPTSGG